MSKDLTQFWKITRKVVAIGRNYAEHAAGFASIVLINLAELGNAVPTSPFFFLKPASSIIRVGQPIEVPPKCNELHHEGMKQFLPFLINVVELGVIIGKEGRDIPKEKAMDYVAGYTLALDMTARELQNKAKEKGLPWTEAKGYDTFCPVGDFIPKEKIPDPSNVELWLKVHFIPLIYLNRFPTSSLIL
jgi:acylpyruvate hydrolase